VPWRCRAVKGASDLADPRCPSVIDVVKRTRFVGMATRRRQGGPLQARIVGECAVDLWGISSEQRLRRQLRAAGIAAVGDRAADSGGAGVLLLRADRLYDPRVVQGLVSRPGVLLVQDEAGSKVAVAAHVSGADAATAERVLAGDAHEPISGVSELRVRDLSAAYDSDLLKSDPVTVLPIREARRAELERRLFDGSYKGVTDLVTKFVWPRPACWATRLCSRLGVTPNFVTAISVVLVVLATWEFAQGRFASGLVLAWWMTFLDTVDGKLARVTVQSSTFGHFLDHGLDVVHPPFWYFAWGIGLASSATPLAPEVVSALMVVILVGYVLGRLAEAAFTYWMAGFSMFCWRPVDSYFRLVLARRNPNLLLLSAALIAGRPDVGLIAVAAWTAISTVFLTIRLAAAGWERQHAPLRSWLDDPAVAAGGTPFGPPRRIDEAA
jgi:phosphatidylglycerophosphate synthase